MNGILAVNKPQEYTSFDVAAIVRRCFGTKKVGHGGTLDPMATGVLPIFIGGATKAADLVPDKEKSYSAGFRLGVTSDTLDIWGKLSPEIPVSVEKAELLRAISGFIGDIEQTPPMYSAIKIGGKKLCDLARQGIEIERKPRKITIKRIELLSFDGKNGIIDVDCSEGTYIRSLIDDIGKTLSCGAVMSSLVRTKSCGFTLSQCVQVDELKTKAPEEFKLFPIESVFSSLPKITLDKTQQRLYLNGVRLDARRISGNFPKEKTLRICGESGEFFGVGRINAENELLSIKRFMND